VPISSAGQPKPRSDAAAKPVRPSIASPRAAPAAMRVVSGELSSYKYEAAKPPVVAMMTIVRASMLTGTFDHPARQLTFH